MSAFVDMFKGAVALNLKYASTLVNLGKEYLEEVSKVVIAVASAQTSAQTSAQASAQAPVLAPALASALASAKASAKASAQAPTAAGDAAPAVRPALLVLGRSGETGNAAFALNNPSDKTIGVQLVVQGDLDDGVALLEPAQFSLKPGEQTLVRILVAFDERLPADQDRVAQVVAPGLSSQGVPFIVRRLGASSSVARS